MHEMFCFIFTAVASSSSPDGAVNSLAACHSVDDCGLAVLPGTLCKDIASTVLGEHLLRPSSGYLAMDETGEASSIVYTSRVAADGIDLVGSAIILHSSDGIQLACGTKQ
jgi:hypothetical protein